MEIKKEKGVIVAFDQDSDIAGDEARLLAHKLVHAKGNFVIKVGRPLEMEEGIEIIADLKDIVGDNIPVIYDGKIADIPFISAKIAKKAYALGADAVICQGIIGRDMVKAIKDLNLGQVIVVVSMSHPGSICHIDHQAVNMIYELFGPYVQGVDGLVVPATRPKMIESTHAAVEQTIDISNDAGIKYPFSISPGIKAQGAQAGDAIRLGCDYEVVGRAITGARDPIIAAEELYEEIMKVG